MKPERRSDILPKFWEQAQGLLPCVFFSDSHSKNHETAQGSRRSSTGWTVVFVWMVTFSPPAHAAPDPDIQSLVEGILEDSIRAVGERLVGFRTRFVGTNSNRSAGDWIRARLLNAGYPEVRFETFTISLDRTLLGRRFILDGVEGRNIVVIKPGVLRPEKFVLLGAHYDSINLSNPGSVTQPDTIYAPGADDNATGTSVVLEIARLLFSTDLDLSIVFVLFDGEELGLWGSRSYAGLIQERGDDISEVLNVDAVGTRSAEFPTAFTIQQLFGFGRGDRSGGSRLFGSDSEKPSRNGAFRADFDREPGRMQLFRPSGIPGPGLSCCRNSSIFRVGVPDQHGSGYLGGR